MDEISKNNFKEILKNFKNKHLSYPRGPLYLFSFFIIFFIFNFFILSAPKDNQTKIIHIGPGETLSQITQRLRKENIIRHPAIVQTIVIFLKNDKQVSIGDYLFEEGTNAWNISLMLIMGKHNINPIKVTFPEGIKNEEIINILSQKIPQFNKNSFADKISNKQGYLFPDTYFFFPLTTEDEIIYQLESNFKNKIKNLEEEIKKSNKSLEEIIIMASLIEGEASGPQDAQIISGILWKRLEKRIPLQVDVDRWTYKNRGLPEKPISNPGLVSIKASLNPTSSPYLYYLHEKDGEIHYAKTYAEHRSNIAKYLK